MTVAPREAEGERLSLETGGHRIVAEAFGPADAPAVVCLHGLAGDRRVLVGSCEPALADRPLRRVYVDLPGHGDSTGNIEAASADALADALATFVAALPGGGPVALLGYAYGGYLAQGMVARLPAVSGVALVCPTVEPDFAKRTVPPRRVAAREDELVFSDDEREKVAFEEVAVQQTRAVLEQFRALVHPGNIGVDPTFMAATRARYAFSTLYAGAVAALDAPSLIVCGRDDHWVGWEDAARLCRLLRRAELAVLPDCGHLLPLESPARFRALLQGWASRL